MLLSRLFLREGDDHVFMQLFQVSDSRGSAAVNEDILGCRVRSGVESRRGGHTRSVGGKGWNKGMGGRVKC